MLRATGLLGRSRDPEEPLSGTNGYVNRFGSRL
jgi:hypothetical protein